MGQGDRRGQVFKRCTKCSTRVEKRACEKCGARDSFTWAYVVDVTPKDATGKLVGARRQKKAGGFASRADAQAAMSKLQAEKASGAYIDPSRTTLAEYLAQWIKAGCEGVRPWTFRGYENVVRNHISPRIGHVPLQKLTRTDIKAMYADLRTNGYAKGKKKGTGLSEKSVHNIHICLRAALNDAVADGLLRANPASGALKPPSGDHEMVTWTREELTAFLEFIKPERDFPMYRLAGYSGMRRGELLGLRWADVKWNLKSLSVQQQLGLDEDDDGERDMAPVKTRNGRRPISLDEETLRALHAHRAAQEFERRSWGSAYRDLDLVFCRPDGTPHDPDTVTHRFEQAVARANLKAIGGPHGLRHTHATLLLEAGVDISVVSRRLGHASVGFTARIYAHVTARLQLDAADKFSAYLGGEEAIAR